MATCRIVGHCLEPLVNGSRAPHLTKFAEQTIAIGTLMLLRATPQIHLVSTRCDPYVAAG